MSTAVVIMYPLVMLLLLPLLVAVGLHVARWCIWGRLPRVWARVAWVALCYFVGLSVTAAVLLCCVLRADRLRFGPQGSLAEADSFVVFSFGLGPDANGKPTAGASNRALALWVLEHNPTRKPTIVQEGVYLALEELNATGDWVIRLSDRPDTYVDTMGAAYQAETAMHLYRPKGEEKTKPLTRPVVLAHDLQLQRAAWSMEAVGVKAFVVPQMPATPFDPQSVQHPGTRNEFAWVVRELLVARPVTLRPQTTMIALALIALLYGLTVRLV